MSNSPLPGSVFWPNGVDPFRKFVSLFPYMAAEARYWSTQALHPTIKVGATVLAYNFDTDQAEVFTGANQNLGIGDNPTKMCAERVAFQKAIYWGATHLVGVVTSGPRQPDTHSGMEFYTLHTCGEERTLMRQLPQTPLDMLIATVDPSKDVYEIYTRDEHYDLHANRGAVARLVQDPNFERARRSVDIYDQYQTGQIVADLALSPAHLALAAVTGELEDQLRAA